MKLWKRLGIVLCCLALILGAIWFCFGERLSLLYRSLQSFKDENLAYTFQHTPRDPAYRHHPRECRSL